MDFRIIRSKRKSLRLEVAADGQVIVRAPQNAPLVKINAFVRENEAWILEKQKLIKAKPNTPRLVPFTETELLGYSIALRIYINANMREFERLTRTRRTEFRVSAMVSRWGSCSARRVLSFNALLALAPEPVRNAVILHELCHLKHMNHSDAFYVELLRCCPAYRECESWLKNEGAQLIARLRLGVAR